jgi:hypothetical protein
MTAIISLLVIVAVSLLIVRVATLALLMTGLSWDVASFQAYSAFCGVGFTTREAELVVGDPTRRRIIKHLILMGNVGVTAGVGSIIVAFVKAEGVGGELKVLFWIAVGLAFLWLLSITPPLRVLIDWLIKLSLRKSGVMRPADFALLLRVHAGYVVEEVEIHPACSLIGRRLNECQLGAGGVIVLGCTRQTATGAEYVGTPSGAFQIESGDVLTVYGRQHRIKELIR